MGMTPASLLTPLRERLSRNPIPGGVLDARVTHVRFSPRRYVLSHRVWYLRLPLRELDHLDRPFLRRNRFGLFSLHDRDYGDKSEDLHDWIRHAFAAVGASVPANSNVALLTLPRVIGFGFNPVSFWLCHNAAGALIAVLAEVSNTFGERHCYLCRKEDGSAIGREDEIEARKVFYVSPFMPIDGIYKFRFIEGRDRLVIRVDLHRESRRVLSATIAGTLAPLSSAALLSRFLRCPFPTFQVVALIHFHAARLFLKGFRHFAKPPPLAALVTAGTQSIDRNRL